MVHTKIIDSTSNGEKYVEASSASVHLFPKNIKAENEEPKMDLEHEKENKVRNVLYLENQL